MNPSLLNQFFLAYQPKVQNGQIVALEALLRPAPVSRSFFAFLEEINDTINLDLSVINRCINDLNAYNIQIPVAINLHPTSLLNDDFIDAAIQKAANRKITFELVEYEAVSVNDKFYENLAKVRAAGIKISIDDFGKDFATASLALSIQADEVKFDINLVKDIDTNFIKFKHISFLYTKIKTLCTDQIVFEGIETKHQKELIELFAENPILQGYYFYKPMLMSEIVNLEGFKNEALAHSHTPKEEEGIHLDHAVYNYICSLDEPELTPENVNNFLKNNDTLGLVYNEEPSLSLANLRNIYFSNSSEVNNGVMALIDCTEKLVIFRNDEGVVIYDNAAHRTLIGGSIIGVDTKTLTDGNKDYEVCLAKDKKLLDNDNLMFIQESENFDGVMYDTIREKMSYNNKSFIRTIVCPSNLGLGDTHKDELTQCNSRAYLKYHLTAFDEHMVAFIDLNGFKLINDTKGHAVGDDCLIDFACLLKASLRDDDTIIRYGGDEFVIIFKSTEYHEIERRLNILNSKISTFFNAKGLTLSFSYGLAEVIDSDLHQAIRAADKQMYINKQQFYRNNKLSQRNNS
ncbi:MAG: GGDEF domain-containing protein [Ferrimonas sp.]